MLANNVVQKLRIDMETVNACLVLVIENIWTKGSLFDVILLSP